MSFCLTVHVLWENVTARLKPKLRVRRRAVFHVNVAVLLSFDVFFRPLPSLLLKHSTALFVRWCVALVVNIFRPVSAARTHTHPYGNIVSLP